MYVGGGHGFQFPAADDLTLKHPVLENHTRTKLQQNKVQSHVHMYIAAPFPRYPALSVGSAIALYVIAASGLS